MSRHRFTDDIVRCTPHQLPEATCRYCALTDLDDLLERIHHAVRAGRSSAVRDVAVTGGAPSWEPINLSALTLEQDVYRGGGPDLGTDREVLAWRDRARVILGDAFAPFPVLSDDVDPNTRRRRFVRCPKPTCSGTLLVQRDAKPGSKTYARPTAVTCSHDREHRWEYAYGGFLRLRAALSA